MPFTFAHPALILPLSKIRSSYISVSCLVVGSITPDFEYFITMKATGRYSHTIEGAFALDLPIAFSIVLIFHSIVKDQFIRNLPAYFSQRLVTLKDFEFIRNFRRNSIGYILCLIVGIFSHLLWDSFTHTHSYFVDNYPELRMPVNVSGIPAWPLFRYLQHGSTLIGLLFISFIFHRMPMKTEIQNSIRKSYWWGIVGLTGIALAIRWAVGFEYFADVVASLISSLLMAIIIISIIFTIQSNQRT